MTGDNVDNGQHLFTGFYYKTSEFLSLIGSSDHVARQERLAIDFVSGDGKWNKFSCPNIRSPLHFLAGLLRYSKFPKMDLLRLILKHRRLKRSCDNISAAELLDELKQSQAARDHFFRPFILATLNADLDEVSARLLQEMLMEILSVPASHSVLAYSTVGFSELIANPAAEFIQNNNGEIFTANEIAGVDIKEHMVKGVVDRRGRYHRADAYILALPPDRLAEVLPERYVGGLNRWVYTPIVSVNLWYDRPVMDRLMIGLTDSHFHWVFDKHSIINNPDTHRYVTLLESAAYDKIGASKHQVVEMALDDMNRHCPKVKDATLKHAQVIKERRATVLISPSLENERPDIVTQWPNLFLAGDWVDTGLPATVESAVKSGFQAADCVAKGR